MSDRIAEYETKRARLVAVAPPMAGLLPEECPERPRIRQLGLRELATVLREPATSHAGLAVVAGWGDGSVIRAMIEDPLIRQKQIHVIIFAGEEPAVTWSILEDQAMAAGGNLRVSRVMDETSLQLAVHEPYGAHDQIPILAGADFVDQHPLVDAAEAQRRQWWPRMQTLLSDRNQAYGNDIPDSFTGLFQSAVNARTLLPAPRIGDLKGFFGEVPTISIAAGPSLKRRLDLLRRLQDRCILVCCDAVLHGLLDAGITPHFVTPLERVPSILPMLTRSPQCSSIYAGLPVCPPEAVNGFGPARAIGLYCGDRVYDWLCPDPGPRVDTGLSTGTLSVSVAGMLTRGPLYLVGHDLSRDETGTHWDGAKYAGDDWARVRATADNTQGYGSGYNDRMIRGNDGGMVRSIAWWDRFRDDIAGMCYAIRGEGRRVYNVNAHDRICAYIAHTDAAPLPDPDSLPPLPAWQLPPRDQTRFTSWAIRARRLPEDCDAFTKHLTGLRDDLAGHRRKPPMDWDPESFAKRMSLTAAVSEGNRMAFAYFLRSALHNVNAELHLKRRTASTARSRWEMLRTMEDLCQALLNAVVRLQPGFEEIAHVHAKC